MLTAIFVMFLASVVSTFTSAFAHSQFRKKEAAAIETVLSYDIPLSLQESKELDNSVRQCDRYSRSAKAARGIVAISGVSWAVFTGLLFLSFVLSNIRVDNI